MNRNQAWWFLINACDHVRQDNGWSTDVQWEAGKTLVDCASQLNEEQWKEDLGFIEDETLEALVNGRADSSNL